MSKVKKLLAMVEDITNDEIIKYITAHVVENNIDVESMNDDQLNELIAPLLTRIGAGALPVVGSLAKSAYQISKPILKQAGQRILDVAKEQAKEAGDHIVDDVMSKVKQSASEYSQKAIESTHDKLVHKTKDLLNKVTGMKGSIVYHFTYKDGGETKRGEVTAGSSAEALKIAKDRYGDAELVKNKIRLK